MEENTMFILTKPYQVFLYIAVVSLIAGTLWSIWINRKNKEQAAIIASYTLLFATVFAFIGIVLLIIIEYGGFDMLYALTK